MNDFSFYIDNKQRDNSMNKIDVTIDANDNSIRVWNNGSGSPIAVHSEHNIYVPELIFGNLLTGSNFDDNEQKTTGGRNGYGSKLANIFSTKFIIETADKSRGKKYRQVFTNNMQNKEAPVLSKYSGSDYTCVTFYPDLARFNMTHLDNDIISLLSKRVHDVAGTNTASGAKLNVFLNGGKIDVRNFESYMSLYQGIEAPCAFERVNDRWEIGVGVSDGSFQQVSFVNSIATTKGGQHCTYIADQITARLAGVVKKKNKGEEVKSNQIKNHLAIYVNALIVNPAFDSQTKETLTTKASNFGSKCVVSEKMMKLIEKSGIVDNILSYAKFKQNNELKKKGGSKKSKLIGITKLDDANYAGSSKSQDCTLILTEGDSAKALAISGLSVVGRDYYGVFPLKGKLLNVREASHQQMMKNEEIQNISKILGLSFGKKYETAKDLRYGHLMIMTDQDHDGSHIKGLVINFIHHFWPSLLKIDGFLRQFITPIVKCMKGNNSEIFYTIPEYQQWKENNNKGKGWKIKYYKGLGTSTAAEAKEYFSNLDRSQIDFKWSDETNDAIDLAFSKKKVDERKLWLLSSNKGDHIDYDVDSISYDTFVNKELILFSQADNERSLPSFVDGLKPSQRKVLFSCFKRNLKNEIKVAQLAGYVSEHSAYHHGEASLAQTIINMAQNYVGSNNINLLSPEGQFGTRLMGGKDAASPRYIFTKLQSITRCIFHPHDDPLLDYLEDDGQSIEPTFYAPIIPMAIVNGCDGIGTGWSTSVPTYNPREIIDMLRDMINGEEPTKLTPWFRGYSGSIKPKTGKDANNFSVTGCIEVINDTTVLISELPVHKSISDYKQFLESVLIGNGNSDGPKDGSVPFVKDFKENHTESTVSFTITMAAEKLMELENEPGALIKKFKLESSVATSNMNMFDTEGKIRKFENTEAVMKEFFKIRIHLYDRRKQYLLAKLTEEWDKLDNKSKFVLAVINNKLVVANRKKADIINDLRKQGFKSFGNDNQKATEDSADEENIDHTGNQNDYDYLLGMKIWSLTMEKVQELTKQRDEKFAELKTLKEKLAEHLWIEDLDNLENALSEYEMKIEEAAQEELAARNKANRGKGSRGTKASRSRQAVNVQRSTAARSAPSQLKAKTAPPKKKKAFLVSDSENDIDDFIVESDDDQDDGSDYSFEKAKPVKSTLKSKTTTLDKDPKKTIKVKEVKTKESKAKTDTKLTSAASRTVVTSSNVAAENPGKKAGEPLSFFERLQAKRNALAAQNTKPINTFFKSSTEEESLSSGITTINLADDDEDDENVEVQVKEKKVKATKSKGLKRISKVTASSLTSPEAKVKNAEVFSPSEDLSPKPKKKAKATESPKPAIVSSSRQTKISKVRNTKKKSVSSDSEAEFDEDDIVTAQSPKVGRARKQTNYAQFYEDD